MASRQVQRRKQREAQRRGKGGGVGGPPRRGGKPVTPWYLGPWGLTLAIILVGGVGYAIFAGQSANGDKTATFGPAPAKIRNAVINPPQGMYKAVGPGGVSNPWTKIPGNLAIQRVHGKPLFFYYGAEFCPHCGVLRWSLLNAISRFGTISGMYLMKSSPTDTYPSTNTFTFVHSHYSSPYIEFQAKEVENRFQGALQSPTTLQQAILTRLNITGFPFVYLANQAQAGTVPFKEGIFHTDPSQTTAGQTSPALSWQQVTAQLKNPSTDLALNVFGEANWLTAGICRVTHNKPANVCDVNPVKGLVHQAF